jgi:hypothetical protein
MSQLAEVMHYNSLDELPFPIINPADSSMITERFSRYAALVPPRRSLKSLEKLLGIADEQLEAAADLCNASVVPHTWGIVPAHEFAPTLALLPSRGVLMTTVDYIQHRHRDGQSIPANVGLGISSGVRSYNNPSNRARFSLADISDRQFLYGYNLNQTTGHNDARNQAYLVDIEPRFRPEPLISLREARQLIADIL